MLKMELEIPRRHVPLGGEILMRARLENAGDGAVETASLYDNNQITNYAILDAAGNLLKTVNHVTRQLAMGRGEPRTGDFKLVTLPAGGEEIREDNLCRYEWFEQPGSNFVRALYRWQSTKLWSEPSPWRSSPRLCKPTISSGSSTMAKQASRTPPKLPHSPRLARSKDSDCALVPNRPCMCPVCGTAWHEVLNTRELDKLEAMWAKRRCVRQPCPSCDIQLLGTKAVCHAGQCAVE
jgi:hypothetical protein